MKYSSRFFLYAPLGVFLLLMAATGIHWWIAATRLGDWLDAKNGHQIMPGVSLAFGERHITGFPFSLDTQLQNVTITLAAPYGPTRWQSEKFAMHALTYGRNETIFEAAGHQTLQWKRADGTTRTLPFAVGSLHASAIVQKGALTRFDLDLIGFGSKAFTAQRLQVHARDAGSLQLLASMDGFRPADGQCVDWLQSVQLKALPTHGEALSGLLSGGEDWAQALADWRKAGGRMAAGSGVVLSGSGKPDVQGPDQTQLLDIPAEQLTGITAIAEAFCGR